MTGLTPFLLDMIADKLAGADPAKLAARYSIPTAWASWYLQQWRAVA